MQYAILNNREEMNPKHIFYKRQTKQTNQKSLFKKKQRPRRTNNMYNKILPVRFR